MEFQCCQIHKVDLWPWQVSGSYHIFARITCLSLLIKTSVLKRSNPPINIVISTAPLWGVQSGDYNDLDKSDSTARSYRKNGKSGVY